LALVPSISSAQLERTDLFGHILFSNAAGIKSYTQAELEEALEQIQAGLTQVARYAQSDAQRAYIEAERIEFSDDWSGISAKLDRAFQSDECYAVNWVSSLATIFGWAEPVAAHYERLMRCDPLSGLYVAMGAQFLIWADQPDRAIEVTSEFLDKGEFQPWADDLRFTAILASGNNPDALDLYAANPEGSFYEVPRKIYAYAVENEIERAREILEAAKDEAPVNESTLLMAEAALGNRDAANAYASILDARFAGPFILTETVKGCFCGAPFDLEATPNFKKRIEEAGFHWPPPSPIKFPAKDW
jgi:hypothetical protein